MNAVVMAGGEGTRLRPLTCDIPKPMARLCGRPVLEYILELLEKNGVTNAALTLRYLPNSITKYFEEKNGSGVSLSFVLEDEPLGTAGSVANAARNFTDDFIVISGDALCDFDLKAAMDYHKHNHAAATIVVKRVNDPREYGLIQQKDGKVAGFVEKPGYSQAVSDLANTGVYILNPSCLKAVPKGEPFDFSKDLFPEMLRQGVPILAYEEQGYWCDIGDLETYAKCQRDMLSGAVSVKLAAKNADGIYYKGQKPQGNYSVEAPVYIGEDVKIGTGAFIGAGSVIDDGCMIGPMASVKGSILLPNVVLGQETSVTDSVICENAAVKRGASVFEKAAIGSGCVLGSFCSINPGVKIWPKKAIEDNISVNENVKTGSMPVNVFDEEGLSGEMGVDITPELCAKIGAAAGSLKNIASAGIAASGGRGALALKAAVAAGLLSVATQVWDFGIQCEASFAYCLDHCQLDIGIFVEDTEKAVVKIIAPGGLPLNRAQEREIESRLIRSEFLRCTPEEYGEYLEAAAVSKLYQSYLAEMISRPVNTKVWVTNQSEAGKVLSNAFEKLGCLGEGGLTVRLYEGGKKAEFTLQSGENIRYEKLLCLAAVGLFEKGQDIAVPYDAPSLLNKLAESHNQKVYRYFYCPADTSDKQARALAKTQPFVRDGLMLTMNILQMLAEKNCDLQSLYSTLPTFEQREAILSCNQNPGKILKAFLQDEPQPSGIIPEGVAISRQTGSVLIRPLKRGGGIRVLAEAENAEFAKELCAFYEDSISKLNLTQ